MRLSPDQVTIPKTDFAFPETTATEMEAAGSITAVFVCRGRRIPAGEETLVKRTPASKQLHLARSPLHQGCTSWIREAPALAGPRMILHILG
jgi:hypothetical protein